MIAVKPNTIPILAILDPITFPNAISEDPSRAACKLTNSSGADVANETTVIPITNFDNLNLNDKATDERTKNSAPTTNNNNPINNKSAPTNSLEIFYSYAIQPS